MASMNYRPITPIKIYYNDRIYVKGEGYTEKWILFSVPFSGTLQADTFYGEWINAHGSDTYEAESRGVKGAATFRTAYIPALYDVLESKRCVIFRGGNADFLPDGSLDFKSKNAFELYGMPDNVREQGRIVEISLKRYEGK